MQHSFHEGKRLIYANSLKLIGALFRKHLAGEEIA